MYVCRFLIKPNQVSLQVYLKDGIEGLEDMVVRLG